MSRLVYFLVACVVVAAYVVAWVHAIAGDPLYAATLGVASFGLVLVFTHVHEASR